MSKIYRVIRIKLNQFMKMSIWSLLANTAYLNAVTLINIYQIFYLQDGGKKSNGIDMKQNYVTVTLCKTKLQE